MLHARASLWSASKAPSSSAAGFAVMQQGQYTYLFSMVSSPPYFSAMYSRMAPLSNMDTSPSIRAGILPNGWICRQNLWNHC